MNRIKLLAVFFSICILVGYYFTENNGFLLAKAQSFQNLSKISSQSDYQKPASQISKSDFNLFISILNNLKDQLNKILKNQSLKIKDSISTQKKSDESLKLFVSGSKKIGISSGAMLNTIDDYYLNFTNTVAKKVFFSDEERELMEKGDDEKRILTLEELSQKAVNGYDLAKLKNSFLAWKNLDERAISAMKLMAVSGEALELNNSLVDWFQFHSSIAGKLGEGNLTNSQVNDLYGQFKAKGAAQNLLMKNSTAQIKNTHSLSLINSANALTCTPSGNTYYFGGKISSQYYCNDGMAFVIATPCGGTLSLSYAVEALNPYFKGFLKVSDYVLGKATISAGTCMLDEVTQTAYEAAIVFYGASGGL